MSKHTPGPWDVYVPDDLDGKTYGIDGADGSAVVYFGFDRTEGIRDIANARLIAAAPELLEALQTVKKMMDQEPVDFAIIDEVIHQAITKATGA